MKNKGAIIFWGITSLLILGGGYWIYTKYVKKSAIPPDGNTDNTTNNNNNTYYSGSTNQSTSKPTTQSVPHIDTATVNTPLSQSSSLLGKTVKAKTDGVDFYAGVSFLGLFGSDNVGDVDHTLSQGQIAGNVIGMDSTGNFLKVVPITGSTGFVQKDSVVIV